MVWLWITNQLTLFIHPRYNFLFLLTNFFALVIVSNYLLVERKSVHISFSLSAINIPALISTIPLVFLITCIIIFDKKALMSQVVDAKSTKSLTINKKKYNNCQHITSSQLAIEKLRVYIDNCDDVRRYAGQSVDIQAFIYRDSIATGNKSTVDVARLVIACCVIDATPVHFIVQQDGADLSYLKRDDWVSIKGVLVMRYDSNGSQMAIRADSINRISQPRQPYGYY